MQIEKVTGEYLVFAFDYCDGAPRAGGWAHFIDSAATLSEAKRIVKAYEEYVGATNVEGQIVQIDSDGDIHYWGYNRGEFSEEE